MNTEQASFQFIAAWLVFIVLMVGLNKTRLGHVAIYYGLLLLILVIIVTEYKQIAPFLNPPTLSELQGGVYDVSGGVLGAKP